MSERMIKTLYENLVVVVLYWGISHLIWMIFKGVGVLPMPIWPAAALALIAALYRGLYIAPGIAIGTVLANHYSLGAPWLYAFSISVMNTIGPLIGAFLIRRRLSADLNFKDFYDFLFALLVGIIMVPLMTATGGVGSKWLLGLLPAEEFFKAFARWATAHSLGTLLFAVPYFIWASGRRNP